MAFRSRLHRHLRRAAIAAALVLGATATAAVGNVHRSPEAEGDALLADNAAPPDAMPTQAPRPAPKPARKSRTSEAAALRIPSDCNPKLTRRQCDDDLAAIERDLRELAQDVRLRTPRPDGPAASSEQDSLDAQHDAVIAEYRARECAERRAELAAARRRHAPRAGEPPMDPAERLRVIEEGERFILERCR